MRKAIVLKEERPLGFYQSLQLDPIILKQKIKEAKTKKEKRRWLASLISRSCLIVAFAVLMISIVTAIFGIEVKAEAVVFFCMLLSLRFVDFGYTITHSIWGLAGVMGAFFILPEIQWIPSAMLRLVVYFGLLTIILLVTASEPKMGNAGLYGFAYIFIVYSVWGEKLAPQQWLNRSILFLLFFGIFAAILYKKHRAKNKTTSFLAVWRNGKRRQLVWLFGYSLSISILIVLSRYSSFQRFMWIGFAFSSLYSSYGFLGITFKERAIDRILGTILGSALFIVASSLLPSGLLSLSGGFILGICSTYRYKTVFNCFGALTVASSLFGLTEASMMRVIDNMIGVGVALLFIWLTQWYSKKMEWYKDRRKQSLLE